MWEKIDEVHFKHKRPKYLEKPHNKFGAVASERETEEVFSEIDKEETEEGDSEIEIISEADRETEEVYSEIDEEETPHINIIQVLFRF